LGLGGGYVYLDMERAEPQLPTSPTTPEPTAPQASTGAHDEAHGPREPSSTEAAEPAAPDTAVNRRRRTDVQDEARAPVSVGPTADEAEEASPEQLADEETLLLAARRAMRSSPSRAMEPLANHARLYPHGMLAQERELIRIQALLALGRREQAEHYRDRFESAYPGSAHLSHLRRLFDAQRSRDVSGQTIPASNEPDPAE
jgi:hypothetical protein